jgi:hypothetical protein
MHSVSTPRENELFLLVELLHGDLSEHFELLVGTHVGCCRLPCQNVAQLVPLGFARQNVVVAHVNDSPQLRVLLSIGKYRQLVA